MRAAACSMADYEDTIFPYLAENRWAHMHHVVLHPRGRIAGRCNVTEAAYDNHNDCNDTDENRENVNYRAYTLIEASFRLA